MKKKEIYSGVDRLVLNNCRVVVDTYSPFKVRSFLSRVCVEGSSQKGDEKEDLSFDSKDNALCLKNLNALVRLPYGKPIDIFAFKESHVTGKFFSGTVHDDESSTVDLTIPLNLSKRMGPIGSTVLGVAGDLGYIIATCVPIAVAGVPLVRFFGGDPVHALDDFLYLSAGVNVGFRGDNKRAFYTSLAVATASILGPEFLDSIKSGLEAGLNNVGLIEDGLKALAYTTIWGAGKGLREYHVRQTERI